MNYPTSDSVPLRRRGRQLLTCVLPSFGEGRFLHGVQWLPQNRRNPHAIAVDVSGARLAILCARIQGAIPPLPAAQRERLASHIAAELDPSGCRCAYEIAFHPQLLGGLLARYPEATLAAVSEWLRAELPRCAPRRKPYTAAIPVRTGAGKRPRLHVSIAVSNLVGTVGTAPAGWARIVEPSGQESLLKAWDHVCAGKLRRLVHAGAEQRLVLLEISGVGEGKTLLPQLLNIAEQRRAWAQVDWFALVGSPTGAAGAEREAAVWDVKAGEWAGSTAIARVSSSAGPILAVPEVIDPLREQARAYVAAAKAQNTLRAYDADWRDFANWCEEHGRTALPASPETVALYLTDRAQQLKTSSLARRLTAITRRHQAVGCPSPASMQHAEVSEVWKGIQRTKGVAQKGKRPLLTADIRRMLEDLPETLQGARDRALLLAGYAGGFRRSELAGLRVEDLEETEQGMVARLRRSKTDQMGEGRAVALPYGSDPATCPVRAVRTWLEQARITEGPLFRAVDQFDVPEEQALHPDSIGWIVKRAAARIGLDAKEFAGHSLRAGLATQAAMNGANELAIMKQTGHRSLTTVRKYIREGSLFRDNAATKLGL